MVDCSSLIITLQQGLSQPTVKDAISEIKSAYYPSDINANIIKGLSPLVQLLNRPDVISCLENLQKYTTYPSWYVVLEPFFLNDPVFRDKTVRNYLALGLSRNFIDRILFYPSGRPRVNMKNYLDAFSIIPKFYPLEYRNNTISHYDKPYYISNMPDGIYKETLIPVIRYQQGMKGYLTVPSDEEKEWCGTFYYFEPASEYLLYSPMTLVTWNKITGCLDLGIPIQTVYELLFDAMKDRINFDENDNDNDNETEAYPNTIGFHVLGETKEEQWLNVVKQYQARSINPLIHIPDLYSAEDMFDQILCETARSKNIQAIVLKFMTGETRVVTEVLDTRARKSSFENILLRPLLN